MMKLSIGKILFGTGILAVSVLGLAASAFAQNATQPATMPTSAPAPAAETRPAEAPKEFVMDAKTDSEPESAMDKIQRELEFTERERQLTVNVRDKASVEENAFYMLMFKLSRLPQLNKNELKQLDSIANTKNLINKPERYRYMTMKLKVRIYRIYPRSVDDKTLNPTPYWDSSKTIYEIVCTNSDAEDPKTEPLILYTTEFPTDLPKTKLLTDSKTKRKYYEYRGPEYNIAGIFYKYVIQQDSPREDEYRDPELRRYPVILAWQAVRAYDIGSSSVSYKEMMIGGIVTALVIVVAYFLLKKRLIKKRTGSGGMWKDYTPLREEFDEDELTEEEMEVDAELVNIVKQYRKDRGLDEDAEVDAK